MAAIHCETEVEVVCIDGVDADVVLRIGLSIVTRHDALDVGSAVALVDNLCSHLGTIHSRTPGIPVSALLHHRCTSSIAIAPTEVVGAYNGIFRIVSLTEDDDEVVPVGNTTRIIGELNRAYLMTDNLDIG